MLVAPYGENRRYDLVLDLGDRFVRVQVKTARLTPDGRALVAATASFAGRAVTRRRVGYRGQVGTGRRLACASRRITNCLVQMCE